MMKNVMEAIRNGEAQLIGESDWEKDSAYRVYKHDNRFYAIVVADQMSFWLIDDTLEEINEQQISNYV